MNVYYIGLEDEPKNGYYEKELRDVMSVIEALSPNDTGFIVWKVTMNENKFNNLPEFMGF